MGLHTLSNVAYALASYPVGVLADRFSKRLILGCGFALFGAMCLGFAMVGGRVWALAVLFAISGVSTAILEAVQPALASALIPEDRRGTGFGVMSAVDGPGDFVSSIAMGIAWTVLSPAIGFAGAAALALLAAAILARA
jgi:MFS family permease